MIGKLDLHSCSGNHGKQRALEFLLLATSMAELPESKHPGFPPYQDNVADAGNSAFLIRDIPGQKPLCCL
ncbi:hypothetical protein D3C71_1826640 [compost metagenome]